MKGKLHHKALSGKLSLILEIELMEDASGEIRFSMKVSGGIKPVIRKVIYKA